MYIDTEPTKSNSLAVLACYKPPSDLVDAFNRLESAISLNDRENKELLLLGDTNCDHSHKAAGLMLSINSFINIFTVGIIILIKTIILGNTKIGNPVNLHKTEQSKASIVFAKVTRAMKSF